MSSFPSLMDDRDLYRFVDEVLHYLWDPIGVAGEPRARDEYYAYVPRTFELLRDGGDVEIITTYLEDVAAAHMGLPGNPLHARKIATVLIEWRALVRMSPANMSVWPPPMPEYDA